MTFSGWQEDGYETSHLLLSCLYLMLAMFSIAVGLHTYMDPEYKKVNCLAELHNTHILTEPSKRFIHYNDVYLEHAFICS
jgi:hypothetical protein